MTVFILGGTRKAILVKSKLILHFSANLGKAQIIKIVVVMKLLKKCTRSLMEFLSCYCSSSIRTTSVGLHFSIEYEYT